jgi:hypothetical protein
LAWSGNLAASRPGSTTAQQKEKNDMRKPISLALAAGVLVVGAVATTSTAQAVGGYEELTWNQLSGACTAQYQNSTFRVGIRADGTKVCGENGQFDRGVLDLGRACTLWFSPQHRSFSMPGSETGVACYFDAGPWGG